MDYNFEMAFLTNFENGNKAKAFVNRMQKIYQLIADEYIDYSKLVVPGRLSLEEKIYLDLLKNKLGYEKDLELEFVESSISFEFNETVYKIYYIRNDERFSYFSYVHDVYSPIRKDQGDVTTKLIVIGKPKTGEKFIDLMACIGLILLTDYVKDEWFVNASLLSDCSGGKYRRFLDYSIVLFRALDSMFDLKFDDFDHINNAITTNFGEDASSLEYAYKYAISKDTTIKDYEDMIRESLIKFQFTDFDNYFESVIYEEEE